jgi:hypothetical protein
MEDQGKYNLYDRKPRVPSKPFVRCPFEAFRFVGHAKYSRSTGLLVQQYVRVLKRFALPRPKQILSGSAVLSRNFNCAMTHAAIPDGTPFKARYLQPHPFIKTLRKCLRRQSEIWEAPSVSRKERQASIGREPEKNSKKEESIENPKARHKIPRLRARRRKARDSKGKQQTKAKKKQQKQQIRAKLGTKNGPISIAKRKARRKVRWWERSEGLRAARAG